MIWDKGIWAPITPTGLGDEAEVDRQLEKGDLKFVLLGEKLAGSWVLVRTRGSRQWLLIKHRDSYASEEDLTITRPLSAVSGRTMTEIAQAAGASPRQLQQAVAADPAPAPPAAAAVPRARRPSPTAAGRAASRPRAPRPRNPAPPIG
jgi:bifunctional non-homologous end joining protein LigD